VALLLVSVRERDVFAIQRKGHCCDTHNYEEDRGWYIIFCRTSGWHEYRQFHRSGAGRNDQEKSPQYGENLQYILDQGMMAEASLYVEIKKNINKRNKKKSWIQIKRQGRSRSISSCAAIIFYASDSILPASVP
jgi:hypothetical protein